MYATYKLLTFTKKQKKTYNKKKKKRIPYLLSQFYLQKVSLRKPYFELVKWSCLRISLIDILQILRLIC